MDARKQKVAACKIELPLLIDILITIFQCFFFFFGGEWGNMNYVEITKLILYPTGTQCLKGDTSSGKLFGWIT